MKIERIKELIESIPVADREQGHAADVMAWIDGYNEAREDIIELLTTQEAADEALIEAIIKKHNTRIENELKTNK